MNIICKECNKIFWWFKKKEGKLLNNKEGDNKNNKQW